MCRSALIVPTVFLLACCSVHGQSSSSSNSADCSAYSTCAACTPDSSCMWNGFACINSGSGTPQTCISAPSGSCSNHGTCATCNSYSDCVWDGFSCIAFSGGSIPMTCSGSGVNQCFYFTCATCTSHASCYWDGAQCNMGPTNLGVTCSGDAPASSGTSSSCTYSSCSACNDDPSCYWDGTLCWSGSTNLRIPCLPDAPANFRPSNASVDGSTVSVTAAIGGAPVLIVVAVSFALCRFYSVRRTATIMAARGATSLATPLTEELRVVEVAATRTIAAEVTEMVAADLYNQ